MAKKICIKKIKSSIGIKPKLRLTLKALGLRKINQEREYDDSPALRGMIYTVRHLISVSELNK